MIEARFDDLVAGAERAFRLVEPVGVIEARRPSEVAGAIDAAESSASRGLWAAGFVAYEAAPGFDPELSVHVRAPDDPFASALGTFMLGANRTNSTYEQLAGTSKGGSR